MRAKDELETPSSYAHFVPKRYRSSRAAQAGGAAGP